MAGFMTKLQGYVYEGELANTGAAPIENGTIVSLDTTGATLGLKPAANADVKVIVKEKTTIYDGIDAYECIVTEAPAGVYFVENGFEVNGSETYDNTQYATPVGGLLRAHPLLVGEEFVTNKVTGTPAVKAVLSVAANGTLSA